MRHEERRMGGTDGKKRKRQGEKTTKMKEEKEKNLLNSQQ